MAKDTMLKVRIDAEQDAKLAQLQAAQGFRNRSELVRAMIDATQTPSPAPEPPAAAPVESPVGEEAVSPAGGPPVDQETYLSRRSSELRLQGETPLMAASLAEAEWRQAYEPAAAAEPEPEPEQETGGRPRACPVCDRVDTAGTGFCAYCGTNLALGQTT